MSNFPTDFFPKPLERIIHETAGTYQFSMDYLSAAILSASATAFGNVFSIRIKEGWIERASLYMVIVGAPGLNKSAPPTFALRPIHAREKEQYRAYKEYIKEFQANEANAGRTPEPLLKSIVSDATPEAVVQQLHKNERGILIYNDELAGFLNSFDRYSKGGAEEFYLSVWSGKPVVVDRKTTTSIMIHEPVVNILGTIQPSVLEKCFEGKIDNGMADRWLLTNPEALEKQPWTEDDLRPEVYAEYKRIIDRLQDLQFKSNNFDDLESQEIVYNGAAWKLLKRWQARNTELINKSTSNSDRAIRSKMETYVHRFALIHHMLTYASQPSEIRYVDHYVTEYSVEAAVNLTQYYMENAIKFRSDNPEERLKGKELDLYTSLPDNEVIFTTNDLITRAEYLDIPEATAKRWLKAAQGKFVNKVTHGKYTKI